MKTPIVLFTYARPEHTRLTVGALLQNHSIDEHDLIIYSDAPYAADKAEAVTSVRSYLETIIGFRSVTIRYRPYNFGLARSIIEGVTEVLGEYERIIVLEDDMITSPHFLSYMNEGLDRFSDDDRVISIHGYLYPVRETLPEAFFLPGADCWGWATWRRGWRLFNPDGQVLLDALRCRELIKAFNFNDTYFFSTMLENQIKGANNSWAVRWYASAFLAGKLTLYPGRSLVHNIGNDNSGSHCSDNFSYDTELTLTPIDLRAVEVLPSIEGQLAFEKFFKKTQGSFGKKIRFRIKKLLTKVFA